MQKICCEDCGTEWYPQRLACCPRCLASRWLATPDLVAGRQCCSPPSAAHPAIRSALSVEMLDDEGTFLFFAAANGTAYYHGASQVYACYVPYPIGIIPGVAVPSNEPVPEVATDRLLILDVFGPEPRAYTCDPDAFKGEVASGSYSPLLNCEEPGCENLSLPFENRCLLHL